MLARSFHEDIAAFFRSIALSRGDWLQDTLRLLTLWFTYGYEQGVNDAISEGFKTVNINVWLNVLPQVRNHRLLTSAFAADSFFH